MEAIHQAEWVINIVLVGIVSVLGFLVRNAFDAVQGGIKGLGEKMDALKGDIARADGDRRVLEARLNSLEMRVTELAREVSEGVVR